MSIALAITAVIATASAAWAQPPDEDRYVAIAVADPEPVTDPTEPVDRSIGIEWLMGIVQVPDARIGAGGLGVRWGYHPGRISYIVETDLLLVFGNADREPGDPASDNEGIAARAGATARLSLWRPATTFLRGDFWLAAGAGWLTGTSDDTGRFDQPDVLLAAGAQYDILATSEDSKAKTFSAYLTYRMLAPIDALDRRGWQFGVGMRWTK